MKRKRRDKGWEGKGRELREKDILPYTDYKCKWTGYRDRLTEKGRRKRE